jgi:hypothetical protein
MLMSQLYIKIEDCKDKQDLIEKIINSGKIDVMEGLPPTELLTSEFENKSVSELKQMLLGIGASTEGMLEKTEMRKALLDSGRVVLTDYKAPDVPNRFGINTFYQDMNDSTSNHSEIKSNIISPNNNIL